MSARSKQDRGPRAGDRLRQAYARELLALRRRRRSGLLRAMLWLLPATVVLGAFIGWVTRFAWFGVGFAIVLIIGVFDVTFQIPDRLTARRALAGSQAATGKMLRPLERRGFTMLHDRVLLGDAEHEQVDVAHLIVGPTGAYLVESRTCGATPRIMGNDLWIGRESQNADLSALRTTAQRLSRALTDALGDPEAAEVPVTPVWAAHAPEFKGTPRELEGVVLVRVEVLVRILIGAGRLWSPSVVERVVEAANRVLPAEVARGVDIPEQVPTA
jgi:hypothetical protein